MSGAAEGIKLSRKDRDRQLRRDDFIRAAGRLFARHGYHETSMEDIAREAEYATGTIYRYFKDKEDLYITLMEKQCQCLLEELRCRIKEAEEPEQKLAAMVRTKIEFFDTHRNFLRLYIRAGQALDRSLGGRMSGELLKTYDASRQLTVELLSECMQRKAVRRENPAMLSAAFHGLIENCLTERMASGTCGDHEEMFDFIMRFLRHGLAVDNKNQRRGKD